MNYSKSLKAIDAGCLITLTFGGGIFIFGFLLDLPVHKNLVGLAVVSGWLAIAVAMLTFAVVTGAWILGRAPWYWKSLSPINFALVLMAVSLFRYNKEEGIYEPILILIAALLGAYFVHKSRIFERKIFLAILIPAFISALGYQAPLFIGAIFGLVSVLVYLSGVPDKALSELN